MNRNCLYFLINHLFHLSKILSKKRTLFIISFLTLISIEAQETSKKDSLFNASSKTFVIVPLVTNSPVMKTGFGGMGLYFFNIKETDTISPPSLVSLYTIYSTNKSYIIAPFGRFFWDQDKNRASFGIGTLRINNDFNYDEQGNDLRLVFSELRNFVTAEYSRKIINDFYIGVLYLGTKTKYKFDQGTQEENDFTKDFF